MVLSGSQMCTPGGDTTSELLLGNETSLYVALENLYPLNYRLMLTETVELAQKTVELFIMSRISSTFRISAMEFKEACSALYSRWKDSINENVVLGEHMTSTVISLRQFVSFFLF
jgi:hypothetical protein